MALKKVYDALEHIASISNKRKKRGLIAQYINELGRDFYMTLRYAGEATLKFNTKAIEYRPNIKAAREAITIFDYLDFLSSKKGATKEEKLTLAAMASFDEETVDVVNRILSKNLKCGIAFKTLQEFITDITDPAVMLCGYKVEVIKKYEDYSKTLNLFVKKCCGWENIIGHVKLDGMRIKYSRGDYFTRSGLNNKFFSYMQDEIADFSKHILEEMKFSNLEFPLEFDGEMMYEGELDSTATDFSSINDIDPEKIKYYIFDIPNNGFLQKERLDLLQKVFDKHSEKYKYLKVIPYYSFADQEEMFSIFDKVVADGQEGLILKNARAKYQSKKSGDWCKVKEFDTLDLPVVGVTEGKGKFKGMVGTFHCLHKGNVVDVARGACNNQEAMYYLKNPPEIIEVKFQEETPDGAFRFPTFFRDRTGDK
jgi:DNA ligase-1